MMRSESALVAFLLAIFMIRNSLGFIASVPTCFTSYLRVYPCEFNERRTNLVLFARQKGSSGMRRRQKGGEHRTNKSVSDTPDIPASSPATQRAPATLAGVVEDHRYEQFFYDEGTANQLYQLVDMYDKPLLLCNPTLAVLAEKKNRPYLLLDRDRRFDFLSGYRPFSLTEPYLITDYDYDAVFIDPPFANVTPEQVARCLRLMAADRVPLYVAYNSRREDALLKAMNTLDAPKLERKWPLGYREGVSLDTQDSIWLYGPVESV